MEKKSSDIDDMRVPTMGHQKKQSDTTEKKALMNRMSRAIGHMESIKRMVEEERDPAEILIQLAAVRSAVSGISRVILQSHIEERLDDAMHHPDNQTSMDDLNKVISYFIK